MTLLEQMLKISLRIFKLSVMFYDFMFPPYSRKRSASILILLLRIFIGVMFFTHGLDKMINFNELSYSYPSVFGFGSYMTLMLSIFIEFCCSLFLIAGFMVRIILVPMIIAMAVAFFDIHDAMFPEGELALIYLITFIILMAVGPGRYSLDRLIFTRFQKEKL